MDQWYVKSKTKGFEFFFFLKIIFGKQGERLNSLTAFSWPHLFEEKLNFSLETRPFMPKESSNQDICEIANSNDVRGQ